MSMGILANPWKRWILTFHDTNLLNLGLLMHSRLNRAKPAVLLSSILNCLSLANSDSYQTRNSRAFRLLYYGTIQFFYGRFSNTLRAEPRSFCLLEWGGEKKAPPELRQAFEVATGQNSGLVKLVFSRQTVFFFSASIRLLINPWP